MRGSAPSREGGMKDNGNKADRGTFALVGFAAGVLLVLLVLFALKGC